MATGDNNNSNDSNSSWWSSNWNSFLETAKKKSVSALEIMKNDLVEFTTVMKNDINKATVQVQETTNQTINKVATTSSSSSSTSNQQQRKSRPTASAATNIQDRFKNEILALQNNDLTYTDDPKEQHLNEYKQWYDSYDPDANKSVISNLLIENATMRGLYSQLVPATVSNKDFWSRYFFKVRLVEDEQKKRQNLIEKASQSSSQVGDKVEGWGDEDDDDIEQVVEEKSDATKSIAAKNDEKEGEECLADNTQKLAKTTIQPQSDQESDDWEKISEDNNGKEDATKMTSKTTIENDDSKKVANKQDIENTVEEKSDEWESWD